MASVKTSIVKICPHCGRSHAWNETHVCASTPANGSPPLGRRRSIDPLIGATLGERYEILEKLNQGGMGIIYKARHNVLGRVVAVKIMLKKQDEATQERFLYEAKLASTLNHPNIVFVSDFGVLDDGRSYIVMEYLQGQTLSSVLRRGRLSPQRSCRIAAQIADGLQAVHEKGIVHRGLHAR
jgi:serine/threonine-protein kinase